jgi:hypothetical protein
MTVGHSQQKKMSTGACAGRADSARAALAGAGTRTSPSMRREYKGECEPDNMQHLCGMGKYRLAKQFIRF